MKQYVIVLTMILFLPLVIFSQEREVKGVVFNDQNGETIPGANIIATGTQTGVISDMNGAFVINVPSEQKELTVSFVGMGTQSVNIAGLSYIEVRLVPGVDLDEVIVTALGISRSAKSLGYSATNLKSEELTESRESNIINSMSGKVAGVSITSSSGGVGSSSRIMIRGMSNLSSDNQPLFVVDGVPVNNSLRSGSGDIDWGNGIADLNPDDIAEMTVLKGAGAAALYGSQAANGVVVIRTKSGENTKGVGIEYSGAMSFLNPLRLPSFQNTYGPGTNAQSWDYWQSGEESYFAWGPKLDEGEMAVQWNSPLGENGQPILLPLKSYEDNFRDFFETGVIFNNNISFSKAEKDKYQFRISYNNVNEKGMIYSTDLNKDVLSMNAGINLSEKIKVNTSVIYSNTTSANRHNGSSDAFNVIKGALFMPRSCNVDDMRNYEGLLEQGVPLPGDYLGKNPNVVVPGYSTATSDYYPNMFYTLDNLKNEFDSYRVFGVLGFDYKITDWLKFDIKSSKEIISELYQIKCNDGVRHWNGSIYSYTGFYRRNETSRDNTTTNFKFLFTPSFEKVSISAFIGGERRDNIMDYGNMYAPELQISGVFNMSNTIGDKQAYNGYYHTRMNSLFGSVDVSFKNGAYLTLTGRNDWSSTLPPQNRSYFYPSASLSWVVSESWDMPEFITFLKARINASQVGADTWAYQLERSYYNMGRIGGIYEASVENTLKNPNLKPTRTNQYELGLDIRMFDSRVNLDMALYTGSSFDQITPVNVSSSSGYNFRYVNVGEVSNKGVEMALKTVPVKRKNLRWDVNFIYTKNVNEVVSLAEGVDALTIGTAYSGLRIEAKPGSAYGNIVGYGFKRDPQGNIIHVNGLPVKDNSEMILGNITPDWVGSFSTNVSYKNFNLSALINVKMGGEIFSLTTQWMRQYGLDEATDFDLRQDDIVGDGMMEVEENGNVSYVPNNVSVPFSTYSYWYNAYGLHEGAVFDASYIKLNELRLGYNLPKSVADRISCRRINVAVVGRNLALLYSSLPHVDPETSISADKSKLGLEMFNMPSARMFTFNLSINI